MNIKHVMTVFKKEVKDIARDKRTLITSLIVPLILYPVLFGLLGGGMARLERDIQQNITVALSQESNTPEIRDLVEQAIIVHNENIRLVDIEGDPVEAIRNNQVRFVLTVDPDYQRKLASLETFGITILYDDADTRASGSVGLITHAISVFNQSVVAQRLAELGINPAVLEPARIQRASIPQEQKAGNPMLMMMIPMMVAIMIAVGGIPAATDLVAGEKERATFEPLLTTKPGRMSILFGKYMTVTLFSFVSVIAQFAGMAVGVMISPGYLTMGDPNATMGGFNIPPLALVLTILITLALGMVFAGIQLAISTYAKSFKEAQTYLSFLIFAAMIPAYATMLLQPGDMKTYMFAVPLLNAIAALKMVLGGVINNTNLLLALATSVIYVAISLVFSAKLFAQERVLFRS